MSIAEKFETIADEVYEKGKQSEYDGFWDDYIYHINNDYTGGFGAFAGSGWTKENCKPNANLKPRYAYQMFGYNTCIEDLDVWCEECGITIDFSKSISFTYTFYGMNSCLKSVGVINTTSAKNLGQTFYGASGLHTIKNLILKEDGTQTIATLFGGCTSLENLTITGKIGQNGFDIHWSTLLTHDSIVGIKATEEQINNGVNLITLNGKTYFGGIFGALSDNTTGLSITLPITSKETFYNSHINEYSDIDTAWNALIATKPNWTIVLS